MKNKLEPAGPGFLARDVFLKTRRLKGLTRDIDLLKYFDEESFYDEMEME